MTIRNNFEDIFKNKKKLLLNLVLLIKLTIFEINDN